MHRKRKNQSKMDKVYSDSFFVEDAFDDEIRERETKRHQKYCLRKAIKRLPRREKEVILLRYFFKFNNHEIALFMNISDQAERNLHQRAIKSLNEHLLENGFDFF